MWETHSNFFVFDSSSPLKEGVIEIDNEAKYVSNILAVAKPNSLNILNSKIDKKVIKDHY